MYKKRQVLKIGSVFIVFALAYIIYFVGSPFPQGANNLICLTGDIDGPSLEEPNKEKIRLLFDVFMVNGVEAYTVFITTRSTPVPQNDDLIKLKNTIEFLNSETKKRNIRFEIGSHSSFHYYAGEDYDASFVYDTMKQSIDDLRNVGVEVNGYRPPNYLMREDVPGIANDLSIKYITSRQEGGVIPSLMQVVQDYPSGITLDMPYLAVWSGNLDDHFLIDLFGYDGDTAGRKMYEQVKERSYPGSTITIQMHPERSSNNIEFVKSFLEHLNKDSERKKYLFVTCSEAVELQRSLKAKIYAIRTNLWPSQNLNGPAIDFYEKGNSFFGIGGYEEAIKYYDMALKEDPAISFAWVNRGVALSRLNRDEEALGSFEKGLEIDPTDDLAWVDKSISLGKLGRHVEAMKAAEKALEIDPRNERALLVIKMLRDNPVNGKE